MHHLSNENWPRLEGGVSPSSAVSWGRKCRSLFWHLPFLCQIFGPGTGDGCVFFLSHEPPSKHIKNEKQDEREISQVRRLKGGVRPLGSKVFVFSCFFKTSIFLTSIAARFPLTLPFFFFLSLLGGRRVPLEASLFSMSFNFLFFFHFWIF